MAVILRNHQCELHYRSSTFIPELSSREVSDFFGGSLCYAVKAVWGLWCGETWYRGFGIWWHWWIHNQGVSRPKTQTWFCISCWFCNSRFIQYDLKFNMIHVDSCRYFIFYHRMLLFVWNHSRTIFECDLMIIICLHLRLRKKVDAQIRKTTVAFLGHYWQWYYLFLYFLRLLTWHSSLDPFCFSLEPPYPPYIDGLRCSKVTTAETAAKWLWCNARGWGVSMESMVYSLYLLNIFHQDLAKLGRL